MRVCVFGLWHLGCVSAACLARAGHDVVGLDRDRDLVVRLRNGSPPVLEPGLEELIKDGMARGTLRFESDPGAAVGNIEVLWVTFDTPILEDDSPQVTAVVDEVAALVPSLPRECMLLVSSQIPVGTTHRLADRAAAAGRADLMFGYSPENLRLGNAIKAFTRPDRIVIGLNCDTGRARIRELLAPFSENLIWMSLASAEMTKHAINAFLATSVAFANELATLCEKVGADAKEVERGLKSEERIGPKAYLSPGGGYAGGTLARDVTTLCDLGRKLGVPLELVSGVRRSNDRHRSWALHKIKERLRPLAGRHIAIMGLTYKPGTSTLRRSAAVALAQSLTAEGAIVTAFDPAIESLPADLAGKFTLAYSADEALRQADAIVIATAWPQFRDIAWPELLASMHRPIIVDPDWFLAGVLKDRPDIVYAAVGLPDSSDDECRN